MASAASKIVLSQSRDIPFNQLVLSQANVRRVKTGVSIEALAEDIARRTLLQSLNVRPQLDDAGQETGLFEVPAGGRRFRALELLVKQKRMAKTQPVPCVVREGSDISAEEDSLAENTHREQLHPLDQFRAMQVLSDQGLGLEDIAAHFMVTSAVVRQRLKLASVSPRLHAIYADDGMTLDQLMAFSVCEDHERQEQVWEMLAHSFNRSPAYIRSRLTEDTVRASDKRVRFVTLDAYVTAGGSVMRDLFEDDHGGWLQDVQLLDKLVAERLQSEAAQLEADGWKWAAAAVDFPWGYRDGMRVITGTAAELTQEEQARVEALQAEAAGIENDYEGVSEIPDEVEQRLTAIDQELALLLERSPVFAPEDMAMAGVFISIDVDGSLHVERGFVRAEDEPKPDSDMPDDGGYAGGEDGHDAGSVDADRPFGGEPSQGSEPSGEPEEDESSIKPLPDKLVCELTAERTLALQDAVANRPDVAFAVVLHAMVLQTFYHGARESCLGVAVHRTGFPHQAPGMADSVSARAIIARHDQWKAKLPEHDIDLWAALLSMTGADQAALFAHCAAFGINAQWEPASRYDGRVSAHTVARRIEHAHVLARAVDLDMVAAGWKPGVENYLGRVTKPHILAAVAEARGEETAALIDHLKKGDMAREAARLLEDSAWLPEPLRTPGIADLVDLGAVSTAASDDLPAFLTGDGEPEDGENDSFDAWAIAAE